MAELRVLRVFAGEGGRWGNPLGVFVDGAGLPAARRQEIAAELGFSETAFVVDRARAELRIHTPEVELPFAGHPTVGAAWLLARLGEPPRALRVPAGELPVRFEGEAPFVTARPEWSPRFEYRQLPTPAQVEALPPPRSGGPDVYSWAWADQAAGRVRARCFAPELGIAEDEATGSAALALCSRLGRDIEVLQGRGSRIKCRIAAAGRVEVGGRVVDDEDP